MERLTKRIDGRLVFPNELIGVMMTPSNDTMCRILTRLSAYEDSGLEPEEIERIVDAYGRGHTLRTESAERLEIVREIKADRLRELVQAEQAARLVVLPCKVGDSIYIPDLEKKIPVKVRVQGISISVSGRTILHFGGYPVQCAWGDGCGKDWFFTSEEAEEVLAQEGGTHEADSV